MSEEKALAKYQPTAAVASASTLKSLLEQQTGPLSQALPQHVRPEHLIRMMLVAVNRTPKLLNCSQSSVLETVMRAATLGLDISGTLGEAYAVPYGSQCTFIVGYRGLAKLARQSGEVKRIEAEVVYEKDEFDFEKGIDEKLRLKPRITGDRGKPIGAYALAEGDGWRQTEWMTVDQINGIMARSRAAHDGPWKTDWPEMARKTVFRRLAKWLPLSAEKAEAFHRVVDLDNMDFEPLPEAPEEPKEEKLVRKLGAALAEEREIKIGGPPAEEALSETPDPEPEPEAAESQARAIPLMIGALLHSLQVDGLLKTCEDYGVAHKKSMKKEDLVAAIEAHIETFGERPEEDAEPEPAPSTIQTGASPAGPDPDEQRRIESGETFGYYRDKLEECADLETYEKIKAEASKPSIAGQLIATDRQVLKQLFAEKFAELGGND